MKCSTNDWLKKLPMQFNPKTQTTTIRKKSGLKIPIEFFHSKSPLKLKSDK
jgi:hypothetical protein